MTLSILQVEPKTFPHKQLTRIDVTAPFGTHLEIDATLSALNTFQACIIYTHGTRSCCDLQPSGDIFHNRDTWNKNNGIGSS